MTSELGATALKLPSSTVTIETTAGLLKAHVTCPKCDINTSRLAVIRDSSKPQEEGIVYQVPIMHILYPTLTLAQGGLQRRE